MTTIFDTGAFNRALFFPRGDTTPPPPGAVDAMIDVGGARVHVRRHPARDARCTLLLFHGNGEVVADYDGAAVAFARCGAELVVADFRGYGASDGEPTLRAVIADARPIAEAVRPAIVMGRSLGGAAAHELYARPVDGMAGVVLESTFSDVRALIRRRGIAPPPEIPERETFDPLAKLPAGRLPLLVLHGEEDDLIVPAEAHGTLAAAGSPDKQLVTIAGRGHNDVSFADAYWQALAAFVERVARKP